MTIYTASPEELAPGVSPAAYLLDLALSLATCAATIAELGCGMGERAGQLSYNRYYGFDTNPFNIMAAKQTVQKLNTEFSTVDILRFQSDMTYQKVLALGELVTADTLGAVLAGWKAGYYVLELNAAPYVIDNMLGLFKAHVHYSYSTKHLVTLEGVWTF